MLVCDVLGDFFSEKYGVLTHPVTLTVQEGYITTFSCADQAIKQDVRDYLFSTPNGTRAGAFAIGT